MPKKPRYESPEDHPVIREVMTWAVLKIPRLDRVRHIFCSLCDSEHRKRKRLYAHSFHEKDMVCWAQAAMRLPANNLAGICLHELGHHLAGDRKDEYEAEKAADTAVLNRLGIEIEYRKPGLVQWVNWKEIVNEGNTQGDV